MAKNITWLGASYSGVNDVELPQTGGGTATFSDASVTTAVAGDVAQGKIFLSADGTPTEGTSTGGGGGGGGYVYQDQDGYVVLSPDGGGGGGGGSSALIITFSQNQTTGYWEPNKTFAQIQTAYSNGQDIVLTSPNDEYQIAGDYDDEYEVLFYNVTWYDWNDDAFYINYYFFDANGVTDDGGSQISTTVEALSVTQNGTYTAPTGTAYSPVTVNVPTGGGGASNVVTGTFTGTTTGAAMDVTLNYSGSGYPIAYMVFPSNGAWEGDSTFYPLVQRYACQLISGAKSDVLTQPSYSSTNSTTNRFVVVHRYKNSTSDANTYTQTGFSDALVTWNSNASASSSLLCRFKSATTMSVYIASTSYGFAANVPYTYVVYYSS